MAPKLLLALLAAAAVFAAGAHGSPRAASPCTGLPGSYANACHSGVEACNRLAQQGLSKHVPACLASLTKAMDAIRATVKAHSGSASGTHAATGAAASPPPRTSCVHSVGWVVEPGVGMLQSPSYTDCAVPLGIPGRASSYTKAMALRAANTAFPGAYWKVDCHSPDGDAIFVEVYQFNQQTGNVPVAFYWVYSGSKAGHTDTSVAYDIHLANTSGTCPLTDVSKTVLATRVRTWT